MFFVEGREVNQGSKVNCPRIPKRWIRVTAPVYARFLFASRPDVMGKVLGIVYRAIATHLSHKAGYTKASSQTGAVTLIQCFGGALNLNVHYHMLFPDGVYIEAKNGTLRFRRVKAPTIDELSRLTHTIAHRVGGYLERRGLPVTLNAEVCWSVIPAMPI